jgi:hypothetical protein
VVLAEHHVQASRPLPVVVDELRVLVPLRAALLVLDPEQLQRHPLAAHLSMNLGAVRLRTAQPRERRRLHEQARLQLAVIEAVRQRPAQPGRQRPRHVVGHRGGRHPQRGGHLAPAQPLPQGQSENLSYLAHGGSGSRHRHLSSDVCWDCPSEGAEPSSPHAAARLALHPRGDRKLRNGWSETPKWVIAFNRNRWSLSAETRGRFAPKYAATCAPAPRSPGVRTGRAPSPPSAPPW